MSEYSDAFERSYRRAQQAYDNKMPTEDDDCGERGHKFRRIPGEDRDGTRFAKCVRCGKVVES